MITHHSFHAQNVTRYEP